MTINRVIVIVLDGVGVGEAPDAEQYGDLGSNSLGNTAQIVGGLNMPNSKQLGLGHITEIKGVLPVLHPRGAFGKMTPLSAGKDSVSGHWELMGIYLPTPFPTYPDGFPSELIHEFSKQTGRGVLGNKKASGTEIIQELGAEHMRSGSPIIYTSADSVFQVAAHEEIIPVDELYHICEISRRILTGEHAVGRVIARPFRGEAPDEFWRTSKRRDYPVTPPQTTTLDKLVSSGREVYTVGKIDEIFGGQGITVSQHTTNNRDSLEAILDFLPKKFEGLLFANLVEFDMIFGHRNDPKGYAAALEEFDKELLKIKTVMNPHDMCIITADHGVDPTTRGTDHSREYVPLLVFGNQIQSNRNLGTRSTLADVAATISELFQISAPRLGSSFLDKIKTET